MSRHVGIGKESTYGTPVAPTEFTEASSESVGLNSTWENLKTFRSYAVAQTNLLTQYPGGDITVQGNFQDLGLWLKLFFGSVDTTGGGPYTHTYPASTGLAARTGLSGTIEIHRDDEGSDLLTWRYAGSKIVGWSMTGSTDQSPTHTFSVIAKSEATGTKATASYPSFDPMTVGDTTVSFDGGSTALPVTSFTLTAAWPVDTPFTMGSSAFAKEPIDLDLEVTGEVSYLLTDDTEYAQFDGTTDLDCQITVDDGTHSITCNLNKTRIQTFTHGLTGRDRLVGTISFYSIFDTTATGNLQVVLVNDDVTIP